jgi:hypothetical protein
MLRIAGSLCCIRRRNRIAESIGLRPRSNSSHQGVDLFIGQHSARTLRKGWHWSTGYSIRGGAANHSIVRNCEKNRIGQSDSCSTFAFGAMTSCAVLSIEEIEVDDLTRWEYFRVGSRSAAGTVAGTASHERNNR